MHGPVRHTQLTHSVNAEVDVEMSKVTRVHNAERGPLFNKQEMKVWYGK